MDLSFRTSVRSLRRFPVLYGLAWALFTAVIGTLTVSLWAHFHALSNGAITVAAYIIHCLAVLAGAVCASRASSERGWYYGGLTGFVYALLMVCIGLVVYNTFSVDSGGLFRILLMAVIGAFGGIIGVNTSTDG